MWFIYHKDGSAELWGKVGIFQYMMLVQNWVSLWKSKAEPTTPYTIYKNQLQVDYRPRCKRQNYKPLSKMFSLLKIKEDCLCVQRMKGKTDKYEYIKI